MVRVQSGRGGRGRGGRGGKKWDIGSKGYSQSEMDEMCEEAGVHTQVLRDEIEDLEECLLRAEIAGMEITFTNI